MVRFIPLGEERLSDWVVEVIEVLDILVCGPVTVIEMSFLTNLTWMMGREILLQS